MLIQWFPGHMTKAIRNMQEDIKVVDLVIYVLDARAPYSCVNPEFAKLIGNKPIIYVLNKSDLADQNQNKIWQQYFTTKNSSCVMLNSTQTNSSKLLISKIEAMLKAKKEKYDKKGVVMINRAMVLGVPNSGKSTLINNFCGKYKAITGDKPGVTKGKQWVRIGGVFELLDTPGTLWPSFENQEIAKNLAYIGSIKEEVLNISDLSLDFIEKLRNLYPNLLAKRYNITLDGEPVEILQKICESRKFLLRGGDVDWDRGSHTLFDDFRKGRMGQITLDRLSDYKIKD
ncbi:MAG: ribosome biogenesis GTPase YlqF [Clostridia bacterium]|nr:ribosome biogenesis GTPase YlqF [Clostridia bacterium]